MNIPELPCTKYKCLKYPVCKFKKTIACDKLFDYIYTIKQDNYFIHGSNYNVSWWKDFLGDTLPNVTCIECEGITYAKMLILT